jgi:hypothetical protein
MKRRFLLERYNWGMRFSSRVVVPVVAAVVLLGIAGGWLLTRRTLTTLPRSARLGQFLRDPAGQPGWYVEAGSRCAAAPFQMPVRGYIGFLWGDSFRPFHRHTGLDIFGGKAPGETPVYAVYDGYLSRPADWKSSLIVRIPADPLQPQRQIWVYYTHMADMDGVSLIDAAFPPGSSEVPVKAGTLLGRMGNFSGTPGQPTGVHLHLSIVLDNGAGKYRDERQLENTLDPSPYFGIALNADLNPAMPAVCP